MAVDVSTLQIKVVSDGIKEASSALGGLSTSANNSTKRITALTDSITALMGVQKSAAASSAAFGAAMGTTSTSTTKNSNATDQLLTVMTKMLALTNTMQYDLTKISTAMTTNATATEKNTQSIKLNTMAMEDAHAAARGLTGSLGALWLTYGNMVPMAAGAAIGLAFKQIVSIGSDVENTLEGIRVKGVETIDNVNQIRDTIMTLGKGVYGPREVAQAFDVLVMAGLSAKDAMHGVRDALNLATVGGTTIEKAAETLVQVGTALDYDANNYNRIGDVIAMTAAKSMSSVESISEAFKAGSVVGKQYGATLEDIGTAFAMLSNLGIKGSSAGTALKNFYSQLQKDGTEVQGALKALGMTMDDLRDKQTGNFKPLMEMFQTLSDHMDKVSGANQKLAISMLANERGAKVMVEGIAAIRDKSAEGVAKLAELRKAIEESYGFTAVGAAAMAMTVENQFKSVKNTLETQFLTSFQAIQPQLTLVAIKLKEAFNSPEFARGIQSIATSLADLGVFLANNVQNITAFVEAFLMFKTVSFVVGLVFSITTGLKTMTEALAASRIAAVAFQASLGILGVALLAAGAAIAWYNSKKDETADATKSGIAYMGEFNGKLDDEAKRLRTQIELMKQGKTATEAQTIALREQQLQMVQNQGQAAIDAATKKRDDLLGNLNAKQQRAYASASNGGAVPEGLAYQAVRDTLAAEQERVKVMGQVQTKLQDAVKLQKEVASLAQEADEIDAKRREANKTTGGKADFTPKIDKAAIAAMNAELDKFHNKLAEINSAIEVQKELNASMTALGTDYDKATDGAKKVALYNAQINEILARQAEGHKKVTDASEISHLRQLASAAEEQRMWELKNQDLKDWVDGQKKIDASRDADVRQLTDEVAKWEAKAAAINGAKEATAEYTLAKLLNQRASSTDAKELMYLDEMIDKTQELIKYKKIVGDNEALKKADASFNKLFDKGRALEFGTTFAQSFGKVGKAIDDAGKGLDKFWRQSAQVDAARKEMDNAKSMSDDERARRTAQLNDLESKNTVDMFATMAGAASQYFDQRSTGYQVVHGLEMTMRAIELADAIKVIAIKMGFMEQEIATKTFNAVTGIFLNAQETTSSVAASETKAAASTTAGVAKAFEQMGVWGFVGAAAILAFMVSMGVSAHGGGGSVDMSKVRQESQGTGTVLGSDTAKSDSATKALEDIRKNTSIGLQYSGRMMESLRNIDNGIAGMAAAVAQTTGLRGTSADQKAIGVGSSSSFLGFSSSSTSLSDSGLVFTPTLLGQILAGASAEVNGYQDIHHESSSFFGLSHSSSDTRVLSGVDSTLQRQIDLTIRNLAAGTTAAAEALGQSGALVGAQLQNFVVDIGQISLKGLSGDDIQKQMSAAFSKLGDQMAQAIVPGFQEFQKVGEGGFETIVRLANGVETAKKELDNLGVSMIHYQDIINKQGDVETELIRQSVALKESGSNIALLMGQMDGSAKDLIDNYKKLISVRSQMRAMNLATDVSSAMLNGADSLDSLLSSLSDFSKGFYSTAEQQAIKVAQLRDQFNSLGLALPPTKEAFRQLVQMLESGGQQDLASRVLALSGAFADAADAVTSAQDTLVSNAKNDLKTAYDNESQAIQTTIDNMKKFIETLGQFKSSLITGDLSPLSLIEKYQTAMAKYQDTYSKAMAGDATAIGNFQNVANDFLNFSRQLYASGGQYTQDFQTVLKQIDDVTGAAGNQVDVATQQLNALNEQVGQLITINTSVLTVAQAIAALQTALTGSTTVTTPINGSHANGLSYVPHDGYIAELHKGERVLTANENKAYNVDWSKYGSGNDALVAEIKALRDEVVALKQSNSEDTNRMIGAQFAAAEAGAADVVDGIKTSAKDAAYTARTQPVLN